MSDSNKVKDANDYSDVQVKVNVAKSEDYEEIKAKSEDSDEVKEILAISGEFNPED